MRLRKLIKLQFAIVAIVVGLGLTAIVNASRNSSGTYSLPSGNPVVSGTTISATVHNNTMSDVAAEITDSLSRSNKGAMLANLELVAGNDTPASPALTWDGDENSGIYRIGADNIGVCVAGAKVLDISTAGLGVTGVLTVSSTATVTGAATFSSTIASPGMAAAGGRLTLTTATPVTTADVTGATTVYYTPYKSNVVTLYDGTNWVLHTFTELSQATTDNTKSPAAVANSSNYDVFVWNDSGTLRATRGPAWTSDTGRGTGAATTELEHFEGRYVNKVAITNGPAARRGLYVGTFRSFTDATAYDSLGYRYVWNNYNRARKSMVAGDTTDTWTYAVATWREARGATNRVQYVTGLNEEAIYAQVTGVARGSAAAGSCGVSIGYDSTSASSAHLIQPMMNYAASENMLGQAIFSRESAGIGYHYLAWLEISNGSQTCTFLGDGGFTTPAMQNGIVAHMNM